MQENPVNAYLPNWRSVGALTFFSFALVGFHLGVAVSERPDLAQSSLLIKIYYSLSLFVMGGVDLGIPIGGPNTARILVWIAYFGAPILFASTLISALIQGLAPGQWQLQRIKDHVIVVGADELTLSYLRVLRRHDKKVPIIVVGRSFDEATMGELREAFNAHVLVGDITHEFFLRQLRVKQASKILLLGANSLRSYEAASILLGMVPDIGPRVVIHCTSLRFMRAMETTSVAQQCQTFNTYHLAASGLVDNHLLQHFQDTQPKDTVILAGFGRFGQTILEQLQDKAPAEMATVVIIDMDAHRRILVADEQHAFSGTYRRELFEGDIGNPDVWQQLQTRVDLDQADTVVVLGTGREEDNLRTALWIKEKFPHAKVIARSSKASRFAGEVAIEHDIVSVSISQLVEDNIPTDWIELG
jgi:Trk K+ transport system NAD-binding subunit